MLNVKVKKTHPNAKIPSYAKQGDAGLDLTAVSKWHDEDNNACYDIGLAFEIPFGYVGLVFPRSSNSKQDLLLSNSVGVIDAGYRGSVSVKFKRIDSIGNSFSEYDIGDRVAQIIIVPYPQINLVESDELSDTERGTGGYGSTGQ